ncbi:hypothetical protein EVAR_94715_1 [Eumeta japonica]|uniref:Uncharacterized protein n=1 Tax=Eumeta variegata TaxID=151549 RepID=A0A4C1UVR9_EUMVA|nr:hypothetical protein EVAR_94715_1 [Eumeta japonica]
MFRVSRKWSQKVFNESWQPRNRPYSKLAVISVTPSAPDVVAVLLTSIVESLRAALDEANKSVKKRVIELDWLIYSLVPHSFFEDGSQYDSDGTNLTAQNIFLNSGQDNQNDMGQIDSEIVNTFETGSPIYSGRRSRRRLTYQSEVDYHKFLIKKKEEEYTLKFQLMREKHEAELFVLAEQQERVRGGTTRARARKNGRAAAADRKKRDLFASSSDSDADTAQRTELLKLL